MSTVTEIAILVLAGFVGYAVISKIPNTLHTPLMSGTNAIHGIVLMGALLLIGGASGAFDAGEVVGRPALVGAGRDTLVAGPCGGDCLPTTDPTIESAGLETAPAASFAAGVMVALRRAGTEGSGITDVCSFRELSVLPGLQRLDDR